MTDIHPAHSCQAIVVTCIDFRFQEFIDLWIKTNITGKHDRLSVAGGVKNLDFLINQVEISKRLHHIKEAFLINHEDCGAYGGDGTFEKHEEDLKTAKAALMQQFPDLKITLFYLKLNGEFIPVNV